MCYTHMKLLRKVLSKNLKKKKKIPLPEPQTVTLFATKVFVETKKKRNLR